MYSLHKIKEKIGRRRFKKSEAEITSITNHSNLIKLDTIIKKQKFILDHIRCPKCRAEPKITDDAIICKCGENYRVINSVPIFLEKESDYCDRRDMQNYTNEYSQKCKDLFNNNPDKFILDFGAGNPKPENLFPNVIRLDFLHYPAVDIVSNCENLPFLDNSFDHIISQSVFEHVRDPWHYADELYRVLMPGGYIMIDTAFLQPVHADPYHFYNMTLHGLEETFKRFIKIQSGVESYQTAGYTMNILRDYYLGLFDDKMISDQIKEKIGDIDYIKYDRYIPASKQQIMSAGVFFIGKKCSVENDTI